jgi:hypothetical protein
MEANTCKSRKVVFSMVCAVGVATQWCRKQISTTVNQHATVEEAVFYSLFLASILRLYNEDLGELRDRIEGVS